MFFRPGIDDHGLPHNPLKAIVSPRPIAWVSSLDPSGRANLAPYSFFNAFSEQPMIVAFGAGNAPSDAGKKDSEANIIETGEFVINIVSADLSQGMNVSAQHYPAETDEFDAAGLEKAPGETVKVPRVAAAPAALECKLWKVLDLPGGAYRMVMGEVTGVYFDDAMIRDGRYDVTLAKHLARLGYRDYVEVADVFELNRPDD